MRQFLSFLLCLCSLGGCSSRETDGVVTSTKAHLAIIENEKVGLVFDLRTGTYSAYDKADLNQAVRDAYGRVNNFTSKEAARQKTEHFEITGTLGRGRTLRITTSNEGEPTLVFDFSLYSGANYFILHAGLENTTDSIVRICSFSPLSGGRLFEGHDMREGFRLVDGQGGGATTDIYSSPQLESQNNLILHFGTDEQHYSLVGGGISYHEFAKFSRLEASPMRAQQLAADPPFGLALAGYWDLGVDNLITAHGAPALLLQDGVPDYFPCSTAYPEAKSVVRAKDSLVFELAGLKETTPYSLGLSWCDDSRSRWQSVWLVADGKRTRLLESTRLPSLNKNLSPQVIWFNLPKGAGEKMEIIVTRDKSMNAVVSEAILLEGELPSGVTGRPINVAPPDPDFENLHLDLYASDPVGKRVDPNTCYLPEGDGFYLGFATNNPLEAAEQYAKVLRDEQKIKLNYYYFPTICMWYAMEPKYGGNIRLGTNDSPGAVAEMERVARSGWLKYTTMGIRLVPDCYEDNNQNGWWGDRHWQMYGSGRQVEEMTLKGGHYRKPYETTEKWCRAIRDLGGLPFMYTQTAVRSEDYAASFPEHMLFNEPYHSIPQYDWLNKDYSTFDFTDSDFMRHMRSVYHNLREGGLEGMMFDYPYLGWPLYGGMDDDYATAGGTYRKIFELAREGLPAGYLHERNIKYGSDITLGLVSSQRTWGDTDVLTPDMVKLSGLRWYKNRTVVNYDMDGKNLPKALPNNSDGLHKLLTMSYVAASRLLLANSFGVLIPEQIHALSRIFPYQQTARSARPLDAFTSDYPRVYGFRVDSQWQALTFYNEDNLSPKTIGIDLSGIEGRGGAGMNPALSYYAYDFWNDCLVGIFCGSDRLELTLRPGEARQIALREVQTTPQVLSTDRHLMQGYLELSDIKWNPDSRTLHGKAALIAGEPMTITLAGNGMAASAANTVTGVTAQLIPSDNNLTKLRLSSQISETVEWSVQF